MLGSLLILCSAFLHAVWNALLKGDDEPRINSLGILLVATLTATSLLVFIQGPLFPTWPGLLWSVLSGLCEGGYFVTLAMTMERLPMGMAYTLTRGGAMIFVWGISVGLLRENVTLGSTFGAAVILAGLAVANGIARVTWPAAVCGTCIAGYHLMYGQAIHEGAVPAAVFSASLWVGLPLYFLVCGKQTGARCLQKLRTKPARIVLGGIICAASFLVFLSSLSRIGAGHAIALRNTSIVFAQILALGIGEAFSSRQWLGASLVTFGAVLMTLLA